MKVIELINRLEQYPPDIEVWIDIRHEGGFCYQDIISDIETFPDISNGIKLKSRAEVREKLKSIISEEMGSMDINKLQKLMLACKTKISDWMQ